MTDLNPETIVFFGKAHRVSADDDVVVHTRKSCQYMQEIDNPKPKKWKVLPDDWRLCKRCAGIGVDHNPGKESRKITEKIASEDFGPEDAGLSPLGER